MNRNPKGHQKPAKSAGLADIELHQDAWQRFENFVTANVPKHPAKPTASRAKAATRKRAKMA